MVATVSDVGREQDVFTARPMALSRGRPAVVAAAAAGLLVIWWGTTAAPVPGAVTDAQAGRPAWHILTMFVGVLPILALHSPMANLECVATTRMRRYQRLFLAGVSGACLAVYLGLIATALPLTSLGMVVRAWVGWLGLALVSGVAFGWRLGWIGPAGVLSVFLYWGYAGDGRYEWWDFSARPIQDRWSATLSLALLGAGVSFYWLTAWRRHRWLWPGTSVLRSADMPG